jgi:8-oxo-dGTP diphosphatase
MTSNRINIVVGIVYNTNRDSILLCKRPPGSIQGGLWELPGGKLKPDESPLQALARELFEEVDIHVGRAHRLISVDHDYPDYKIRLSAWIIDSWSGVPRGKEGQTVEWTRLTDLDRRQLPAANIRIMKALGLPLLYLITPDQSEYDDRFLQLTEKMISSGLRLLQFRSTRSNFSQHGDFVRELAQVCKGSTCGLLYNGPVEHALAVGAHGVHLQSSGLMQLLTRPLADDFWVGASCHDEREIVHAGQVRADFCVLAPVHQTGSHPSARGMGWNRFEKLAGIAHIPVYALGGIKPEELDEARHRGAHGVAMISAVWNTSDPVAVVTGMNQLSAV